MSRSPSVLKLRHSFCLVSSSRCYSKPTCILLASAQLLAFEKALTILYKAAPSASFSLYHIILCGSIHYLSICSPFSLGIELLHAFHVGRWPLRMKATHSSLPCSHGLYSGYWEKDSVILQAGSMALFSPLFIMFNGWNRNSHLWPWGGSHMLKLVNS